MALEISYWSGVDVETRQCYGRLVSSESLSLSGTSAQSGAAPAGAAIARCRAGENCRITNSNDSPTASASNGVYLAAGEVIDIDIAPAGKIAGITA